MDDRRKDFSDDLHELKEDIDVGNILAVLHQRQQATRPISAAKKPVGAPATRALKTSSNALSPARAKLAPAITRAGLQNVTTRLTPETNEILRRAALQQQLQRLTPSTRQEIIEEAIRDWAQRRGYLRDAKTHGDQGHVPSDLDADESVTP